MPKKIIKKMMPNRNGKVLSKFQKYLTKESFSYQRKPILRSFLIGTYISFLPIPFQMLVILFFSVPFKANVPIAMSLAWITNPITMPFIFFVEYKIGNFIINGVPLFEFKETFLVSNIPKYFLETFVGGSILGVFASVISYIFVFYMWKGYIIFKRKNLNK